MTGSPLFRKKIPLNKRVSAPRTVVLFGKLKVCVAPKFSGGNSNEGSRAQVKVPCCPNEAAGRFDFREHAQNSSSSTKVNNFGESHPDIRLKNEQERCRREK